MHEIPWYLAMVISIPQTLLVFGLGFRLFNLTLNSLCLIVTPVLAAFASYYFRYFHLSYALNLIFLILLFGIFSTLLTEHRFSFCLMASLSGTMIYSVLETLGMAVFLQLSGLSFEAFSQSVAWNIILFLPIAFIMAVLWWWTKRYNLVLFDLSGQD